MLYKNLIMILTFCGVVYAQNISLSGACACNSVMARGFTKIDDFIVDDNLKKIDASMNNKINEYNTKLQKLRDEIELLEELIKETKEENVFLTQINFESEKEKELRANTPIEDKLEKILSKFIIFNR